MYEERGRERERHLSRARANTRVPTFFISFFGHVTQKNFCRQNLHNILFATSFDCFRLALKESQLREPRGRRCRSTNFLGTLGRLGLRFSCRGRRRVVSFDNPYLDAFRTGDDDDASICRICAWHPSRRRMRAVRKCSKRSVKAHRESVCRTSGADRISAT